MKELKNIIYAIIFSIIGGAVSITGYNYMYPRNNTVAEINNDKIKFANYIYDTTDVVVPEGLNFIYTSKKTTELIQIMEDKLTKLGISLEKKESSDSQGAKKTLHF